MLGWDSNVSSWRLIVPAFIYLEVAQNLPNLACSTSKFLLFGLRSGQCWLGCGLALKAKKDVPFLDQEHLVRTRCGSVTVAVYGDEDKPALVTYPDVGLNCECHHRFYNLLITAMTGFCNHQPNMAHRLLFFCCGFARLVLFPRIVLLPGSCVFAAPQFLHLPHQSSGARGQ